MSETSLDNTICASAVEPKQGLGDSGREERHPLGGWIDLPTRAFSLFAGQMLPDKNAAAAVGNGGEALHLLATDVVSGAFLFVLDTEICVWTQPQPLPTNGRRPGRRPRQNACTAQIMVHIWNDFQKT